LRVGPTGGVGATGGVGPTQGPPGQPGPTGSSPATSSGGSPSTPPIAGNPSGGPVASGTAPAAQFDADVEALAERMRPNVEDRTTMLAATIPNYVDKARNLAPKNLPRDVELPRYALVIRSR
jgi:hypothetical protein